MARLGRDAILIPANPSGLKNPALGSILLHARHAEHYGKVFWDVFPQTQDLPGPFPHPEIRIAYFYDVIDRLVRYKAKVHGVFSGRELARVKDGKKYLLKHRRGDYGADSWGYWVLLSCFCELKSQVRVRGLLLQKRAQNIRH